MTTFRVTSVTFAHPNVPAEHRARLALVPEQLAAALKRVRAEGIDAFVLATCLRTEVGTSGCERALGRVLELLYPGTEIPPGGVYRRDREAIHHLFRVAAGLDSPIVGEPEVLGQFRAALDVAQAAGVVGGLFEKTLQSAVATGKSCRRKMGHPGRGSIALAAAAMAEWASHVAVFGAGAMAQAAAKALQRSANPPTISVYTRRPGAVRLPVEAVLPLSAAPAALAEAQVVISATAAKGELFGPEVLNEALQRRSTALLLIDLAMPPDFSPAGTNCNLQYRSVDDLAAHVRMEPSSADVESLVEGAADEAWTKLSNHHGVGPVIAAILDEADRAVREEVQRFAGRLSGGPNDARIMNQLAQTIAHRVLHRPLSFLSSAKHGTEAAAVLAQVFGVSDDS